MSVHYAEAANLPTFERRRADRFRFSALMPAILGRGDALILDISTGGALVSHFVGHAVDSTARLVFSYADRRFSATARVLAGRVTGLGNGPRGSTSYESRLQFVDCPADSIDTLNFIIEHIEKERLRGWVSNLSGDDTRRAGEDSADSGYFTRCCLRGGRWSKCWTRDPAQPRDGFTVPAKLSVGEVEILCEAYAKMDDEGRQFIRATATMAA